MTLQELLGNLDNIECHSPIGGWERLTIYHNKNSVLPWACKVPPIVCINSRYYDLNNLRVRKGGRDNGLEAEEDKRPCGVLDGRRGA